MCRDGFVEVYRVQRRKLALSHDTGAAGDDACSHGSTRAHAHSANYVTNDKRAASATCRLCLKNHKTTKQILLSAPSMA